MIHKETIDQDKKIVNTKTIKNSDENEIFYIQNSAIKIVKKPKNYEDTSNIGLASIGYSVGLRATAAIATAAWVDRGLISKNDNKLIIDHSKGHYTVCSGDEKYLFHFTPDKEAKKKQAEIIAG